MRDQLQKLQTLLTNLAFQTQATDPELAETVHRLWADVHDQLQLLIEVLSGASVPPGEDSASSQLIRQIQLLQAKSELLAITELDPLRKSQIDNATAGLISASAWLSEAPTGLKRLFNILEENGYESGSLSVVGVLGLAGEAGEILNELNWEAYESSRSHQAVRNFINAAEAIDELKKSIRNLNGVKETLRLDKVDLVAFDKEVADQLYYVCTIIRGRGKTVDYYANLSVDKILAKRESQA